MRRPVRRLIGIALLLPVVALLWLTSTQSGLRWAYRQMESSLPGELTMTSLEGRLLGPITAQGITYRNQGVVVSAEQAIMDWRLSALLGAHADIRQLHIQALNITLPEAKSPGQPLTLPDIELPWRVALRDLVIDGMQIRQNQTAYDIGQLRLNATTLLERIDIEQLSIIAGASSLNLQGVVRAARNYGHKLELDWQTVLPSGAVLTGKGTLAGDLQSTRLQQQLGGPLQLTLEAELRQLLQQFNWQAQVEVAAFDTTQLQQEWPALSGRLTVEGKGDLTSASLTGTLNGNSPQQGPFDAEFRLQRLADNSVQIEQLMLYSPTSETRLQAHGDWTSGSGGGDVNLALQWQNLRWPLQDGAWFHSASGSGQLKGNLTRYQFALSTDRPWPQAPPSHWDASGEGDINGVDFHSLRITALNGEATATGRLNWSPVLSWQAEASAVNVDPATLWPQWPGQLNARLTSSGRYENGQLFVAADISDLQGTLRDYPVSLRTRFDWRDGGSDTGLSDTGLSDTGLSDTGLSDTGLSDIGLFDIGLFDFRSGSSRVSARGRAGETLKLEWSIDATDLAELYPQARGQLQAKGVLGGVWDTPTVQATYSGKVLRLPGYEIGAIDGSATLDLFRWRQVEMKLAAQALRLRGYALQSLDIDAHARQLHAQAAFADATAELRLRGEADTKGWRGTIEQLEIRSTHFSNWQLEAPAALHVGTKSLHIAPFCLHNAMQASLCNSLQRGDDDTWQTKLQGNRVPLQLLSHWLPPELKLEGVADASAELQFESPDLLLGKAQVELPAGVVNYPLLEGEHERWEYQGGKLELSLTRQGLEASAELDMPNGDQFRGRIELPGARVLALDKSNQPLQASSQLNIHSLGLIEAITPEVHDLRGEIELNVTAAGTLAQPRLKGDARLQNGSLQIPRLGLTIDQLRMTSRSDGFEKLEFRLDARSGTGDLAIEGHTRLDREAGWPTQISIKGKEFEVSRIPEARVLASPDLRIKLQKYAIDIQGDVHIPYARWRPRDLTSAASVSRDAVILGSEQPAKEKWAISSRVRLLLGERVQFYGFGFEGRLGGSLLLVDRPEQLTTATGEITIPEGRYRAYGQWLNVEQGRLLYSGGPLANPGLDVRAVRHIGEVTAGLKARGTISHPQLELFSVPAMGQTDTLAYLLLGGPIESASGEEGAMMSKAALALGLSGGDRLARTLGEQFGLDDMRVESSSTGDQTSLVMGRYLSPRLYVSYGVGLIEALNTLSVRYKISDKWQLKAESGEYQGADILYTIER